MVDVKRFKQAVWETRKKYGRGILRKSQLKEAFELYEQARGNLMKFQELIKGTLAYKTAEKMK